MTEPTAGTDKALFRVFSKGTTAEGQGVRRSANWALARRGWLRFFPDRLELGDWRLPYADIEHATLFRLRTLLGGYVLRVTTANQCYQFGMNPWALAGRTLPFPHDEQVTRVGYSLFSVVVRILALAYLLAWAFGRLRS